MRFIGLSLFVLLFVGCGSPRRLVVFSSIAGVALGCVVPLPRPTSVVDYDDSLVTFCGERESSNAEGSATGTDDPFERVVVTRLEPLPYAVTDPRAGLDATAGEGGVVEETVRGDGTLGPCPSPTHVTSPRVQ